MFNLGLLLLILPLAFCIHKGDLSDWTDSPYLVKVLVSQSESALACTGTQITPSHVLTSAKCFREKISSNGLVLSHRDGNSSYSRRIIKVEMSAEFAILTLKPRKVDQICPREVARLARLPLQLSLLDPAWSPVNIDDLENNEGQNCRIRGFETVPVEVFHEEHSILTANVSLLVSSTNIMTSIVQEQKGACWDDIGLPLECELPAGGIWMQVGMLSAITRSRTEKDESENQLPDETEVEKKIEVKETELPSCDVIAGMKFTLFSDDQLPLLLLKAAKQDLFETYTKCF